MKLEYQIDEQDFLDFQLFTASQSDRIRRKMLNEQLLLTLIYAILAGSFYFFYNILLTISFGIISILCGLFYPKYFRWRYKRHYKTYIRDNYANEFGEFGHIEINDNTIFSKDKIGESTLNISEIKRVDETEKHFFVKITASTSLIIPKYKIPNSEEVRAKFELLGFSVNKLVNNKWK